MAASPKEEGAEFRHLLLQFAEERYASDLQHARDFRGWTVTLLAALLAAILAAAAFIREAISDLWGGAILAGTMLVGLTLVLSLEQGYSYHRNRAIHNAMKSLLLNHELRNPEKPVSLDTLNKRLRFRTQISDSHLWDSWDPDFDAGEFRLAFRTDKRPNRADDIHGPRGIGVASFILASLSLLYFFGGRFAADFLGIGHGTFIGPAATTVPDIIGMALGIGFLIPGISELYPFAWISKKAEVRGLPRNLRIWRGALLVLALGMFFVLPSKDLIFAFTCLTWAILTAIADSTRRNHCYLSLIEWAKSQPSEQWLTQEQLLGLLSRQFGFGEAAAQRTLPDVLFALADCIDVRINGEAFAEPLPVDPF